MTAVHIYYKESSKFYRTLKGTCGKKIDLARIYIQLMKI